MNLYSKIKMLCESIFYSLYYSLSNIFGRKKITSKTPSVIVSLTSYPGRISTLFLTIESLIRQDYSNYIVVLYLSDDQFPERKLPSRLTRLVKRGLIIKYVSGDIRSFKKLHYALQEYPNLPILTADDDIIYPRNWLSCFIKAHEKYPRDILYARGHKIQFLESGEIGKYEEFTEPNPYKAYMNVIPTGVSGIFYPVNSFHKDVLNTDIFLKYTPFADDVWYRIMAIMAGVKCRLIYNQSTHFTPIIGTQFNSLRNTNLNSTGLNNDAQLRAVLDFYNLDLNKLR